MYPLICLVRLVSPLSTEIGSRGSCSLKTLLPCLLGPHSYFAGLGQIKVQYWQLLFHYLPNTATAVALPQGHRANGEEFEDYLLIELRIMEENWKKSELEELHCLLSRQSVSSQVLSQTANSEFGGGILKMFQINLYGSAGTWLFIYLDYVYYANHAVLYVPPIPSTCVFECICRWTGRTSWIFQYPDILQVLPWGLWHSIVVWLLVIQIDHCSLLPTTTIHIKIKTHCECHSSSFISFLMAIVCSLSYDLTWCWVGTLFFHLMTWYTMRMLSIWRGWYVTYSMNRPGVELILSLFSSNDLVHNMGIISAGILCEHALVAWRVLHRLVEWHWDKRLIEAIGGHDHRAPLGRPHSDDFNMTHFCQGC